MRIQSLGRHSPEWLTLLAFALCFVLTGCVGPPVLERQVLGYDEVSRMLDEKLLLLNIARLYKKQNVHFTATSSIAATFDWTTSTGVGGQIEEPKGVDFFNFNFAASASENPTFSIVPVSGEEFTKRVVTPFRDDAFEFLVFQGGRINQVMRLMADGIEFQGADGQFVRFVENDIDRPNEYKEFRQIAHHLQWLNDNRQLFVRTLVFNETLIDDFEAVPRAEDVNNGFNMGLRWRQKPNGNYELTRLKAGRVAVTNYDPMSLTDRQRFELNERIRMNPRGFVFLDIRPNGPGGDLSVTGAIKLRSMFQILNFLAEGIGAPKDLDVKPDPRTGSGTPIGPLNTLKINVTDTPPETKTPLVFHDGSYYSVNDTFWDRISFTILNILFQSTVGEIEDVGIPITISK